MEKTDKDSFGPDVASKSRVVWNTAASGSAKGEKPDLIDKTE